MKPYLAEFLELRRRPNIIPNLLEGQPLPRVWRHLYTWDPPAFVPAERLPFRLGDEVYVVPGIALDGKYARTNLSVKSFDEFVLGHPTRGEAAGRHRQRAQPRLVLTNEAKLRLLEEFPGLTFADLEFTSGSGRRHLAQSSGAKRKHDAVDPSDSDDERVDVAKVEKELRAIRSEWALNECSNLFFGCRVLGGKWTAEHKGQSADAFVGVARALSKPWCIRFQWPKQMAVYFSKYGGRNNCWHLVQEWVNRSTDFIKCFVESGQELEKFRYSDMELSGYESEPAFIAWVGTLEMHSEAARKAREVDRMKPINP